jgi:putative DNA primase/helicase
MIADTHELKEALIQNAEELISYALGKQPDKLRSSRRDMRWGTHGSFSSAKSGRKRGLWYDHEAQKGGDIFDLIGTRILGTSNFREICDWGRRWLGWLPEGPGPQTSQADRQRRERAEKQEENDNKEQMERQRRLAKARAIWDRSQPISGTLAELYLTRERKINAPEWPESLRFDPKERALVVKVTNADGELVGVQIIRLTVDGRKLPEGGSKRPKLSYGLIGSGAVRPHAPHERGPLLVAEGPETGLSVWSATGYETWIALGSISKLDLPNNRKVVVCRDDDDRRATSRRSLTKQIRKWRLDGFDISEVFPWDRRRYGGLDFNDLMQEEGPAAIRARIILALREHVDTSNLISISAARIRLDAYVSDFFALARNGNQIAHALQVTLGVGKTEAALKHAIRNLNELRNEIVEDERLDHRIVVFAVPEHRLSEDIQQRIQSMPEARELTVMIWRGREARDPDGKGKMCENTEDVSLAQSYLANIRQEVCPECPYFDGCPYLAQESNEADVIIVAHNMLFHEAIPAIKKRGILALIVDESPWKAGLTGVGDQKIFLALDALDIAVMPVPVGDGPMGGARLIDMRSRLKKALSVEEDGPVRREALLKLGFDKQSGADGAELEWRRKCDSKSGHWRDRSDNQTLKSMVHIWRALELLLDPNGPKRTGYLELGRDKTGARIIILRGHSGLGSHWLAPTLLIDATLDVELIKPFWPDVFLVADIHADAPYQRVFQTSGRSFGKSLLQSLDTSKCNDAVNKKQASRRYVRRKVAAFVCRVDREMGGRTLVVGNKRIVEDLKLPSHIQCAHFNAVAGRDEWRNVSAIVVVGRTQPPPKAIEQIAGALTGVAPNALEGWYPGGDIFRQRRTDDGVQLILDEADAHPDPMCERIRSRIAEGEVMQAIGRGRGVSRDQECPLALFVLTDVALPLPIDDTLADELIFHPTPEDLMLAEGGVAFEDGSAAALAYPELWKSPEAARAAMHRASSVTFPYKDSYIGDCNAAFRLRTAIYQRRGNGQRRARATIDMLIVSDPQAELERLLGPLVFFELLPVAEAPKDSADTERFDVIRAFCLEAMAKLYLDAPIHLSTAASEREMLAAYRLWSGHPDAEAVKPAFRLAWQEVLADWDLGVMAAADKLWEEIHPEKASQRLQRAMALFDAYTDLQTLCPNELTQDEWLVATGDASYIIHVFATDAIEQGWPVRQIFGTPHHGGGDGLVYFLKGESVSEFLSDGIVTASGRVFQKAPTRALAA